MSLPQSGPRLVLASGSAARASLLRDAGLTFARLPPHSIDESAIKRTAQQAAATPENTALTLATAKATEIATQHPHDVVLGADQLLVCEGAWFDKPRDLNEAASHLRRLRGRIHTLMTAVVAMQEGQTTWQHTAQPSLHMRHFSDAFLDSYLATEGTALLTCVGAYRLEGLGIHLFDHIEGEHTAILGLPMLPLLDWLRQIGIVLG